VVVAIGTYQQPKMFRIPAIIALRTYAVAALVILLAVWGAH